MALARGRVDRAARGTQLLMESGLIAPTPDAPHPAMGAIDR